MPVLRSLILASVLVFPVVSLPVPAHAKTEDIILSDDFKGIELTMPDGTHKQYPDPTKWGFTFWPGIKWPDSYGDGTNWLDNNGESQTYVTPRLTKVKGKIVPAALRYDPFSIQEDGLHITADVLTPSQQQAYQVGGHRRFGSGLLLSRTSFTYGKIKVVAKLPSARGSWPAIWLLAARNEWPPELDLLEGMAWGPHSTEIHSGYGTRPEERDEYPSFGDWFDVGVDPSQDFHEYVMNWNKDTVSAYFDGKKLWEKPTTPSMHQPMYLIINLAVGGKWPANEMGVKPTDDLSPERLGRASDLMQSDYPADMVVKSVEVTNPD